MRSHATRRFDLDGRSSSRARTSRRAPTRTLRELGLPERSGARDRELIERAPGGSSRSRLRLDPGRNGRLEVFFAHYSLHLLDTTRPLRENRARSSRASRGRSPWRRTSRGRFARRILAGLGLLDRLRSRPRRRRGPRSRPALVVRLLLARRPPAGRRSSAATRASTVGDRSAARASPLAAVLWGIGSRRSSRWPGRARTSFVATPG